ncbi:MAG: ion transporter [Salinivirgaceae bacterium]|jgi:voltage-gated sodium channel|nr:ion transporter [Salinivirgaceae bacterium]
MIKRLFLNDNFILWLILINSVILFIDGYFSADSQKLILRILDNFITFLFIAEMIVKLMELGIKGYFQSNWRKFDFILVMLSIPAFITFIFDISLLDVSFLLVFRILRVFKTFRFFKFIPNVGELLQGVQRALKASVFVLISFVIYIFVIGILSFYLFKNSGSGYYSDPMISLYSTFKIFTIEGWFEIPEQIIAGYSESTTFFIYLYFIFVVLTGGIFGLSIVNSIFVDSMISDNNDGLEKKIDSLDHKVAELIEKLNSNEAGKNTR